MAFSIRVVSAKKTKLIRERGFSLTSLFSQKQGGKSGLKLLPHFLEAVGNGRAIDIVGDRWRGG